MPVLQMLQWASRQDPARSQANAIGSRHETPGRPLAWDALLRWLIHVCNLETLCFSIDARALGSGDSNSDDPDRTHSSGVTWRRGWDANPRTSRTPGHVLPFS